MFSEAAIKADKRAYFSEFHRATTIVGLLLGSSSARWASLLCLLRAEIGKARCPALRISYCPGLWGMRSVFVGIEVRCLNLITNNSIVSR